MDIQITKIDPNSNPVPPKYETKGSSGMDLYAHLRSAEVIRPQETVMVPTGWAIAIPPGYEGQIRPRSGLAVKHGVTILNTPGTVDSDYRGEVKVILHNLGRSIYRIEPNARIAQLVIAPIIRVDWNQVKQLVESIRGQAGFGSTGGF